MGTGACVRDLIARHYLCYGETGPFLLSSSSRLLLSSLDFHDTTRVAADYHFQVMHAMLGVRETRGLASIVPRYGVAICKPRRGGLGSQMTPQTTRR